jgi:hypothetical protein
MGVVQRLPVNNGAAAGAPLDRSAPPSLGTGNVGACAGACVAQLAVRRNWWGG